MQALTPTVFPCYAPAHRTLAVEIARLLERGAAARVFLDEGEIRPGEDLAGKARDGRMADVVVVLFSRGAVPPRWTRALWEGPLIKEPAAEGVRIAFGRCDDYAPPRVLEPQFDCRVLAGRRALKRWVRNRAAEIAFPALETDSDATGDLEALGIAIADRPGVETAACAALALAFAHEFREDFDAVFRLECGRRSLVALAGDLGAQLEMRLEGEAEENLARLREFCAPRRFLLLLDDAAAPVPELEFGGCCSVLYCAEAGPPEDRDAEIRAAQRLAADPGRADWETLCQAMRQGRRVAREQGRVAELFELMREWNEAAEREGDAGVMNESARELVWILEGWGRAEEARAIEYRRAAAFDEQMPLLFDDFQSFDEPARAVQSPRKWRNRP